MSGFPLSQQRTCSNFSSKIILLPLSSVHKAPSVIKRFTGKREVLNRKVINLEK
jgi:hypothetical protein